MQLPEDPLSKTFQMKASYRSLILVNGLGAILFAFLLYFIIKGRAFFDPIFAGLIVLGLIAYFVLDYILWQKRGIRQIEVDKKGVRIFRGKEMKVSAISPSEIKEVDVFTKMTRRVVHILKPGSKKLEAIPMFTFFRGPRERITNDAFDVDHFELFIILLKKLEAENN
jgi:hypothetical protein